MQPARKLNLQTVLNRERVTASKGPRNSRKATGGTDQEESPSVTRVNTNSVAAGNSRTTIKSQRARQGTIPPWGGGFNPQTGLVK